MTQHILSPDESALLDVFTADLAKTNDEIYQAQVEQATVMVKDLTAYRYELVRQINELLKCGTSDTSTLRLRSVTEDSDRR